jgi:hypothetical protein
MEIRPNTINGKIANRTESDGWIILLEENGGLPNVNITVLIATRKGFVGTGSVVQKRPEVLWHIDCCDCLDNDDVVIAFRQLPEPPNLLKGFVCTNKDLDLNA